MDGHGDWLSSKEPIDRSYENRKKESRALAATQGPSGLSADSSLGITGLGSSIGNYSQSCQYDDVKNVYTHNSVIGVSEDDYDKSKQYDSVDSFAQNAIHKI